VDDAHFVSHLAEVPGLRTRFVDRLRSGGVEGEELEGWALVFTELVNNAIEHGCRCDGDKVRVTWGEDRGRIVVSVANPGSECISEEDFDAADCEDFADTGRGAGLFIIRAWADEVRVHPRGATTEVEVSRRRTTPAQPGSAER
jgi:anti-sigma regulatory factor (Ser/Thr protein kinase)